MAYRALEREDGVLDNLQALVLLGCVLAAVWIPSPSATPGGINGEAAKRGRRHR